MYCAQCGAQLGDGARFCGQCGTRIEAVKVEITTEMYIKQSPPPPPKPKIPPLPPTPCPTCGHTVTVVRKRKLPCPGCGCALYVEWDPETREKVLLNNEGHLAFEARARELGEIDEGLRYFGRFGLTRQMIEDEFALLREDGRRWTYRDAVWAMSNKLLLNELSGRADLQKLHSMYYNLALLAVHRDMDPAELLRESNKMELLEMQKWGGRNVMILGPCGCDACKELKDRRMTIDEALREQPIPNPGCTFHFGDSKYPFCRCMYSAAFSFELKD